MDEDGYISRDELYRMFKSYFYLSMELVRDVVSAMEDEMMDNFEFSASQPVSAAFNVAIPSLPSSSQNSSDEESEEHHHRHNEHGNNNNEEDEELENDARRERRRRRRYPNKENYFQQQYRDQQQQQQSHDGDNDDNEINGEDFGYIKEEPNFEFDRSLSKNKQRYITTASTRNIAVEQQEQQQTEIENDEDVIGPSSPKRTWEEKFPIMETMSQDAINEMVDKTFKNIDAKREGYISLEEFRQCVQTDSSIVSWFEALGTVF